MKSTGIIRRIDDLGRVLIPREIRKRLCIDDGDPLEIFVEGENVIFAKYCITNDINAAIESAKRVASDNIDLPIEKTAAIIAKLNEAKKLLEEGLK